MTVHKDDAAIYEWVFVVDCTHSMHRELPLLLQSLTRTVARLKEMKVALRVGLVAYQDYGERSVTFHGEFQDGIVKVLDFGAPERVQVALGQLRATGGGDRAECVEKAMEIVTRLNWTPADGNGERRCPDTGLPVKCGVMVVTDAPPHGLGDDEDHHSQAATDYVKQVDKFVAKEVPCHTFGVREFQKSKVAGGAYQLMAQRTGGRLVRMESLLGDMQDEEEKCKRLVEFFCNTILIEFEMEAVLQQVLAMNLTDDQAKQQMAMTLLAERTEKLNLRSLDGDDVCYRSLGGYNDEAFEKVTTASEFAKKIKEEGVTHLNANEHAQHAEHAEHAEHASVSEGGVYRSMGSAANAEEPVHRSVAAEEPFYRSVAADDDDETMASAPPEVTVPLKKQRVASNFQKHTNSERMQALLARRLAV